MVIMFHIIAQQAAREWSSDETRNQSHVLWGFKSTIFKHYFVITTKSKAYLSFFCGG